MLRALRSGLVFALLSLTPSLSAQVVGDGARADPTEPPVANAVESAGQVRIDGRLNEAAWQRAAPITGFRQFQPDEGASASLPTEVRVIYDEDAIYIGARMHQPGGVAAPLARRDQLLDASGDNGSFNSLTTDKLIIDLDPYHNHLDDVLFEVNPAGVKGDQFDGDPSWDPVWEAATQVDSTGWTAELRIPYSQLRFSRDSMQTWGMQIWRYVDRLHERDMWSFWPQSGPGGPAFFGDLEGLRITDRPRQMELLPYAVSGGTFRHAEAGDPYHDGHDMRMSAGGDLKLLLTSNLTLDATVNPDFAQVEVDPATLNLTAFETYYEEKRPFFIAGSSAFSFGGMRCMFCSNTSGLGAFYSRRIGRPPQLGGWVHDNSAYADVPDNTTILGAAKITGRTQGGYTVGVLDALTSRETATYRPTVGSPEATQVVEPFTNYFVGRVKKEFSGGETTFGGIVTSAARRIDDSLVEDRLRSHAEAAGVDWRHWWKRRTYSWMGSVLVSNVAGSPAAIASTQRSSAHYFQRPDRKASGDGLFDASYDPAATSLRGYGLFTRVGKDNGTFLWEAMSNIRSPGFEVNDLAYLNRADYVYFNGNVGGSWTRPTSWYRSVFTSFGGATQYNYDGDRTWSQIQAFYSMDFLNYWRLRAMYIRSLPSLDDQLTRGGPVVKRTGYDVANIEITTDARRSAVFDITLQGSTGVESNAKSFLVGPGLALKPAANIFLQLSPTYHYDETVAQYVASVDDPTATAFYGTRYVFGFIKTRAMSLDTRLNWTFTPNLTLQLFAQPFIASGDYSSFREFARPRTLDKLVYGQDIGTIDYVADSATYHVDPDGSGPAQTFSFHNPDFTNTALRGTAVLRWEYRPGSTIYFVWTQQRSGHGPSPSFDFNGARRDIFDDRPVNVFQVKATWWVGR